MCDGTNTRCDCLLSSYDSSDDVSNTRSMMESSYHIENEIEKILNSYHIVINR